MNGISWAALQNFTFANMIKHPTAFITVLCITLIFMTIIACVPRVNDKPLIAQLRPWTVILTKQYYKYKETNEILLSKDSWYLQYFKFSWIALKNSHPILSIFLRSPGTNFSGPQRALCTMASILTNAAMNALYYGHADVSYESPQSSALITMMYASISSSLVPMVLEYLFSMHTPSMAHQTRFSLYDILHDKVVTHVPCIANTSYVI